MQTRNAAAPRYLIARYTPDLMRGEQHNIGVILWTPQGVVSRFLGVPPEGRGSVDGRRIPSYVTSQSAYRQWIDYWTALVNRPAIEPLVGGAPVEQSDPEYLNVLKSTSNGNFTLSDGGFLTSELAREELSDAVDYLFATLVKSRESEPDAEEADGADAQPELKNACVQLLRQSTLISKDTLYRPYALHVSEDASGASVKYRFDYAVAAVKGEPPHHVYQRVPLLGREGDVQKSIYSAAWMFSSILRSKLIERENGAALILATPKQLRDRDLQSRLSELSSVTRVFNLYTQKEEVLSEFRMLAAG